MAVGKRPPSKVIFYQMIMALLLFYIVYYMVSSLLFGAFRLQHFDGKIPFDFERCCTSNSVEIVNMLSMILTFLVSTGVFLLFIRSQMWDYAITIAIIHLALSCLVMLNFPTNWQWWITYVLCVALMILVGEVVCQMCFNNNKKVADQADLSSGQTNLVT